MTQPSNTERQKLYVYYRGEPAEWLKTARIFGRDYYDIKLKSGIIKTVPATQCTKQMEGKTK